MNKEGLQGNTFDGIYDGICKNYNSANRYLMRLGDDDFLVSLRHFSRMAEPSEPDPAFGSGFCVSKEQTL